MYRLFTAFALLVSVSPVAGQITVIGTDRSASYRIDKVEVNADVRGQSASVLLAQTFVNQSSRTIEAQFLFPLPDDAAISGLTLIVDGKELPGELKKREDARRIYENIVRQQKDPALLEYVGQGVFKTSVFPIPANANRRVEIRYTQLLKQDGGLIDFTLPLGTFKHAKRTINNVSVNVRVDAEQSIKTIYSPTHDFEIKRPDEKQARCKLRLQDVAKPDDVRLLFGTKRGDIGMNLISYRPEAKKDGYFLLLASPRVKSKKAQKIAKTVLFVVDTSGSMSGEKIEQAKSSLKYMVSKLGPKDTFNIIAYSTDVALFREELEVVNEETRQAALGFVDDIYAGGGTNINGALMAALKQLKDKQRPAYVMFMTDGLPTVGTRDEKQIAAAAKEANQVSARIFNFGVGFDVNSRLLDRLSRDNRGTSIYVTPNEDIEVASSNLFRKVQSPALTDVKVVITPEEHDSGRKAIRRVYPRELTDLFRGEQLVMVGRYRTGGPTKVVLTGEVNGKKRSFELDGRLASKSNTGRNSYVEKLWATRRIGEIIDELDLNGRNKELIDELVALSLRYGIMTPYTSFLADENTLLTDRGRMERETRRRLSGLSQADGQLGFGQRRFKKSLQSARTAAPSNADFIFKSGGSGIGSRATSGAESLGGGGLGGSNGLGSSPGFGGGLGGGGLGGPAEQKAANEKASSTRRVRQIGSKTFYWKKNGWEDSELADEDKKKLPLVKIEQYTKEYFDLAARDKGKWSKFLSLTEPVEVVLGGKRYRIVPSKSANGSEAK